MEKKEKLIQALKSERDMFIKHGHLTTEHDDTIDYLETGKLIKQPEDFSLLDAAINDFETLCSDYDVK